jgi:hypothetical protein
MATKAIPIQIDLAVNTFISNQLAEARRRNALWAQIRCLLPAIQSAKGIPIADIPPADVPMDQLEDVLIRCMLIKCLNSHNGD